MTEMGCKRPVKFMKMGRDQELEMAVFLWFKQKREEGIPITGIVLAIHAVQARDCTLFFIHRPYSSS